MEGYSQQEYEKGMALDSREEFVRISYRGKGRRSETAGMKTTSSKTNNNDSKDNAFCKDEAEKTPPPLMGQNMIQSSFGQVDPPQNISPNSQMSLCNSQTDSHLQSAAQNGCKEASRGLDWDQEVESVFMEEIVKMTKQMV